MSTITATFNRLIARAAMIRKAQTETADDFVGCEVLEQAPNGSYAVAVITAVEWVSTVLPRGWGKGQPTGDWCILIRPIAGGYETWVNQDVLTLTGTKYDDAGAAVIQAAREMQERIRMEVSHE